MSLTFFVTGGAGFIGSALVRYLIQNTSHKVINIDKLTYAGNTQSLEGMKQTNRYYFEQVDICNVDEINRLFRLYQPDVVMHLAAESHVDRSISAPSQFIQTNIIGTYTLLEAARTYWQNLEKEQQAIFRFHHISTDEVFGDLVDTNQFFTEETPYAPSSPYSASKASSDHLVRAWHRTYKLPVLITNCSNNYGPYQFPEKLIPLMIFNALNNKPLPVYGSGCQIRDWLYVEDHVCALYKVVMHGIVGETYNIGGHCEKKNIDVIYAICDLLQELRPQQISSARHYREQIMFISDRPGHDQRYAINASKIHQQLGWRPQESFETGLRKTVEWCLSHSEWYEPIIKYRSSL